MLEKINNIANNLVKALQEEFIEQGHIASGRGVASIRSESEINGKDLNVKIFGLDYLQFVNDGRRAGSMPPVDAIREWVEIKGIASGKEADSAAWAIATAIKREGSPTAGAFKHTNNGRRTEFIEHTMNEHLDRIISQLRKALMEMYREEILNTVLA